MSAASRNRHASSRGVVGISDDRLILRKDFEQAALATVACEIEAARIPLLGRGVKLSAPEVVPFELSSDVEIRVDAYREDQIQDALEARIWDETGPSLTLEQLGAWFRAELPSIALRD